MVDYHSGLVSALETVLPTHYELNLHISYQETNNYDHKTGDTLGYSYVSYRVKVWANDIATIQKYALMIDKVLHPIGFKRVSSGELHDKTSTMIQKIMTYEALALEDY